MLQGIAAGNRYWQTARAGDVTAAIRDQDVIKALCDWRSNPESRLQIAEALLTDRDFVDRMAYFTCPHRTCPKLHLSLDDVLGLAEHLFAEALARHGRQTHRESIPGFKLLSRSLNWPVSRVPVGFVLREMGRALKVSLRFVSDIERYWGREHGSHLSPEDAVWVHRIVARTARRVLREPQMLVEILDPEYPRNLADLIRPSHLQPSAVWGWMIPLLLCAAEQYPNIVIPQLAVLVSMSRIDKKDRLPMLSFSIDHDFIAGFFENSGQVDRLMKLLSESTDLSGLPRDAGKIISAVRNEAANRCKGDA